MTDAVRVTAPVRVADVGGWTDTWFGSPGRVCHLAVGPGVAVEARRVEVDPRVDPVLLHAPALGQPYRVGPHPDPATRWSSPLPGRQPLLEHTIAAVLDGVDLPSGTGIDVTISSSVPPGASLGTSASVVVALIAALDALVDADVGIDELAELAHRVETMRAGREAGVQDQWAAVHGGAELLSINPYPSVARTVVDLAPATIAELDDRLVTVVFAAHDSSAVHGHVITDMVTCSSDGHDRSRRALRDLSALAGEAAAALGDGDLDRWGAVLTEATDAQRRLRAELVGSAHQRAIEVAVASGATGWKVNGAGGEGGSLTVLAADATAAERLRGALATVDRAWTVLDLRVEPTGVTVRPVG